jgi:hypothetical protein
MAAVFDGVDCVQADGELPFHNLCFSLGPETSYPDRGFSWISSFPPGKFQDSTLNWAMTTTFHILSN